MVDSLGRRAWIAGLTGVPFGIYKLGFGWYHYQHTHPAVGFAVMAWGAVDIIINALSVVFPGVLSWCLLANVGRRIDRATRGRRWEQLLLAADTTASFAIVSVMIWFGRLPLEPAAAAHVWNIAVIANVLAVGIAQLHAAVVGGRRPAEDRSDHEVLE